MADKASAAPAPSPEGASVPAPAPLSEGRAPLPEGPAPTSESAPAPATPAPLTVKLTLAYDGGAFHGWQEQPPSQPGVAAVRTVQGTLRLACERVLRHPVTLSGAGRTDAGVHARGQVASLVSPARLAGDPRRLLAALNGLLPEDLCVREVAHERAGFDARFSATGKRYRYRFLEGRAHDPFERAFAWHLGLERLDLAALEEGARNLLGKNDFRSFARTDPRYEDREGNPDATVRTITAISLAREGRIIALDVSGDGFLYNMVRAIAGTLVEVGRGHRAPAWVAEVLAARDRRRAGPTAPPHGLSLEEVWYPGSM